MSGAEKRKLQRQVHAKKLEYLKKLDNCKAKVFKAPCTQAFEVPNSILMGEGSGDPQVADFIFNSTPLPLPAKVFNLQENDNENILQEIKKIKKTQEEHSALLTELSEQNKKISEFLAETNVLLKKSLGLFSSKFENLFPLHDEEGLQLLEQHVQTDSKQEIISVMRGIIKGNLKSNFTGIFHEELIIEYNFDGVKEKKCLKSFETVINAIFAASSFRVKDDFISEIKTSLKAQKNRIHKAQNRNKTKNDAQTSNKSIQEAK